MSGTERIIDLSEEPAWLNMDNSLLVISRDEQQKITVPLTEIAALVVGHPQIVCTQAALAGVAQAGGMVVVCNDKWMPAAMLLPLEGHYVQGERFALQAQVSLPTRKRLWRSVVKAKIRSQARLLQDLRGHDAGLTELALRVRSGDPSNVEGEAARRYWPALFADPTFRRSRTGGGPNSLLNYGYAVLRAIVARAICAAGLHPSFGLHHHNRYDAFRLADDLMEPFRPIVDRAVVHYYSKYGSDAPLDKHAKSALIGALFARFPSGTDLSAGRKADQRTLFDLTAITAASLAAAFAGDRRNLLLPEV